MNLALRDAQLAACARFDGRRVAPPRARRATVEAHDDQRERLLPRRRPLALRERNGDGGAARRAQHPLRVARPTRRRQWAAEGIDANVGDEQRRPIEDGAHGDDLEGGGEGGERHPLVAAARVAQQHGVAAVAAAAADGCDGVRVVRLRAVVVTDGRGGSASGAQVREPRRRHRPARVLPAHHARVQRRAVLLDRDALRHAARKIDTRLRGAALIERSVRAPKLRVRLLDERGSR